MNFNGLILCLLLAASASAQGTFSIVGSEVPTDLLRVNYGKLPKGVRAFDLIICNRTTGKQPLTSTEIYQSLAESAPQIRPIGRQIMLALVLRNQQRSAATVLSVGANAAVGVLSVFGAARSGVPLNVLAGAAVGSMVAQQLVTDLRPVLSADQVERYESQVLEPALVIDGGACVERTMFALTEVSTNKQMSLAFRVR